METLPSDLCPCVWKTIYTLCIVCPPCLRVSCIFIIICMQLTGIVRLPCKLLMAAWASACPWNFTKAQPATKQYKHTDCIKLQSTTKWNKVLCGAIFFYVCYLCWCRRVLSIQYTHLCCQRVQTAFWRPHRSVAFPACPQTTSCPLRDQEHVEEKNTKTNVISFKVVTPLMIRLYRLCS